MWDFWHNGWCGVAIGICLWALSAGVCLANDAGPSPDQVGSGKPPGQVGGPCLADGTCTDGSICFKLNDQPICLFPPNTGSPTGQNCPPHRQFVQCDPNGNNCRVICYELRGFGCQLGRPSMPLSGFILGCLCLLWFFFRYLQRPTDV